MPYPTGAELLEYLQEQGMVPTPEPSEATLDRRAATAALQWERASGWRPFLSTGVAETRTFHDAPNGLVDLGGGLLSIDAIALGDWAVSLGSEVCAETYGGDVVTALTLLRGGTGPLTVTGVWGCVADLPPDVFEAVLAKAALSFVAALQTSTVATGALKKETAGPVTYEYDTSSTNATSGKAATLGAVWDEALEAWRRETIV